MDRVEVLLRFQVLIFVYIFGFCYLVSKRDEWVDFRVCFCMLSALCRFGLWTGTRLLYFFLIDGGFPRKLANFPRANRLLGSAFSIWVEGLLRLVRTAYCCIA